VAHVIPLPHKPLQILLSPVNILPENPTILSAFLVTYYIEMALVDNVLIEGNMFNDLASQ
jgi:hypothetical protein